MRLKILFLSFFSVISLSCENGIFGLDKAESEREFKPTSEFDLAVETYTSFNIEGFHVLVQNDVTSLGSSTVDDILFIIQEDLTVILNLDLNENIKSTLIEVPIFIEKEETSGAAYYAMALPSDATEQDRQLFPKTGAVTISNIGNYRAWTIQNQPFMMLHELTHAYHDLVFSYDNAEIREAYENAIDNELYQYVLYNAGGGNTFYQEFAYAYTDHIEFFAEVTEAYFGRNDYYPFNRDDLQAYDPATFDLVERAWEQNGKSWDKSKIPLKSTNHAKTLHICSLHD